MREIERIKLRGEISAERKKIEVFQQAANEEEHEDSLMRLPLSFKPTRIALTAEATQPCQSKADTSGNLTRWASSDQSAQLEHLGTGINPQSKTHNQSACEDNLDRLKPNKTNTVSMNPSTRESQEKPEQALLAEAIVSAINRSTEVLKIEAPKPHVFFGELTEYPDWRAAVNRFIRDRQGLHEDKLALLRLYLAPELHRHVNAYCTLGTELAFKQALETLDEEFGDQFQISKAYKLELSNWSRITSNDGRGLKRFAGFLKQCTSVMEKIKALEDLNSLPEKQKILRKLPIHLERKWIEKTTKFYDRNGTWPKLKDLCKFLQYKSRVACNPLNDNTQVAGEGYQDKHKASGDRDSSHNRPRSNQPSHTLHTQTKTKEHKVCAYCTDMYNHYTSDCGHLIQMDNQARQKFMSESNLCFHCLNSGHKNRECRTVVNCQITDCQGMHATTNHNNITRAKTSHETPVREHDSRYETSYQSSQNQ